jgi:hypothetical protein
MSTISMPNEKRPRVLTRVFGALFRRVCELLGVLLIAASVARPWATSRASFKRLHWLPTDLADRAIALDEKELEVQIGGSIFWVTFDHTLTAWDRDDRMSDDHRETDWGVEFSANRRGEPTREVLERLPQHPKLAYFLPMVARDEGESRNYAHHAGLDLKTIRLWSISFPTWLICALLLWPLWLNVFTSVRARFRARRNRCIKCGYDLRASPDRCPECGAAPTPLRE